MTSTNTLVKTLDFQLDIQSDNEERLRNATFEARNVYNETIRLAKSDVDRADIARLVAEKSPLVKNTTQRVVAKAFRGIENYYEHEDFEIPSHTKDGSYPLRANYAEGYNLNLRDDEVAFRISTEPYQHVTGLLNGSDTHLDVLKAALSGNRWEIGTAEALYNNEVAELHVTVTDTETEVREKEDSDTVVGVDVNEDNVALTALSKTGVRETLVIDFPEIKSKRHQYFTMRKRIQKAGKDSLLATLGSREKRFVRDRLHKVSRQIVAFAGQFKEPCIVFEDLKGILTGLDYGTRMNRRLHRIPFRALQFYTSYKAAFEGIPTAWIDPEYTSQTCALTNCEHTEQSNRKKKRFRCRSCGHQDHADRNASVNIAKRGMRELSWNVPALNSLPQVRKVRRQASGAVDAPTVTRETDRGDNADGTVGVFD